MESLDIAFIARFTPKKDVPKVLESLCEIFKKSIISDKVLKLDVISGMVLKHVTSKNKQEKLMRMIGMRKIENELDELVYEQYGDELDAKDKQLEESAKIIKSKDDQLKSKDNQLKSKDNQLKSKDNQLKSKDNQLKSKDDQLKSYQKLIKKLDDFDDLNTPEARKIINSLMLLK